MVNILTIKHHNLVERILNIFIEDITKDADEGQYHEDDCMIRRVGLNRVVLDFDGTRCGISVEVNPKRIRLLKHTINIEVSVEMYGESYYSTINLLDLNRAFTHFGFKLNKTKLENLLADNLIFLCCRIKDVIELALVEVKKEKEEEEKMNKPKTFVTNCCKKEVVIEEAILNHGMCNDCMDKGVEESNRKMGKEN